MFSCQKRHCFYIVCKLRLLYSLYLVNKDIRESYCCLCNWFSTTIHHHSKCRMNLFSEPSKANIFNKCCWTGLNIAVCSIIFSIQTWFQSQKYIFHLTPPNLLGYFNAKRSPCLEVKSGNLLIVKHRILINFPQPISENHGRRINQMDILRYLKILTLSPYVALLIIAKILFEYRP